LDEKSLKMLSENREQQCCGEMCRETVPEIGGRDWKSPSADSNEVVRWHSWSEVDDRNLNQNGTSVTRVK